MKLITDLSLKLIVKGDILSFVTNKEFMYPF